MGVLTFLGSTGNKFFPPDFCHSSKDRLLNVVIPTFPKFFPLLALRSCSLSLRHCSFDIPLAVIYPLQEKGENGWSPTLLSSLSKTVSLTNVFHCHTISVTGLNTNGRSRKGRSDREGIYCRKGEKSNEKSSKRLHLVVLKGNQILRHSAMVKFRRKTRETSKSFSAAVAVMSSRF